MQTTHSTPVELLLVEDDDGDAKAVQRAFKASKILNPIQRVVDGVEALDVLRGTAGRQRLQRPYIMLVDMNMPRMDGIQLVKNLRDDADLALSVVFMLTTSKREQDRLAAYQLNVAGYIVKERAGEDFLNVVNLLQTYWRVVELP